MLVDGVKFDGYDASAGFLLDAKGPGYEKLFKYGFGFEGLLGQAARQTRAAQAVGGVPIVWRFAEQGAADGMARLLSARGIVGINIQYFPVR